MTSLRFHAPYLDWAKHRPSPRFDLAISNVLACGPDDIPGARDALSFAGRNDDGYPPLVDAIARRYLASPDMVTTATGTSGANFLVCAALLEPGDEVVVERPGYDPLLGAPRLMSAKTERFDRIFADGFEVDPERVKAAITSRTKLVIITSPHNPTGSIVSEAALKQIGRYAGEVGALVIVDEVYLDAADVQRAPAATLGEMFITTSSLTKSYGLASLRCGWTISSPAVAERIRRARDVVDGSGSIVAERLATLAFQHLDALHHRARTLLARNRAIVVEFLESRGELEFVEPEGGTVVFPRIRGVADATTFATRLLDERETAVVPGRFFEAPAHVRIGFSGETDTLRGGLERIGAALDAQAW
jgi:aspartate/methionine/tyrosine aminotransferase